MAETLVELVARISADASELKKALAESEHAVEKTGSTIKQKVESIKIALKGISTAWGGVGAALVGSMGIMVKAAADEEANINRLSISLKNVGVSYDSVKDSLEGVIAATQKKTGISDSEQRDALNELLMITGDYNTALEWLPAVLDLSAAKTMDVVAASRLLGRAAIEDTSLLKQYGIVVDENATSEEVLAAVMAVVGGQAEANANPFNTLKNEISNMGEKIGLVLLPTIKDLIGKFVDIIDKVKVWTDANPKLVKALAAGALAIAGIIAAVFLLKAAIILLGTTTNLMFGGILILIGALVTAGVLLWQNWDKVSKFLANSWDNIKIAFATAIKFIINTVLLPFIELWSKQVGLIAKGIGKLVGFFNKDLGASIEGFADKMLNAREVISDWADSVVESAKASKSFRDVERDTKKLTETLKEELEKQKADALSALNEKKNIAQQGHDDAIKKIKEEYGEYKTATKNKMDLARDASDAERRALEDGLRVARRIHDEKISLLEKEYDQRIRTLNAEADAQISAIQNQIDAIDAQTQAEDRAITRAGEAQKLEELKSAIDRAATAEDLAKAKEEYEEYATRVARNELLRQRDEEKNALHDRIDDIRIQTKTREEALRKDLTAHKAKLDKEYAAFEENQNKITAGLDRALEKELIRLEKEKQEFIALEQTKLNETLRTLAKEEESINASFAARLTEAAIYQAALESTLKDVTQTITITQRKISSSSSTKTSSGGGGGGGDGGGGGGGGEGIPIGDTGFYSWGTTPEGVEIISMNPPETYAPEEWFQHGGIFTQPSIIGVGEAGAEAVIPLNEMGTMGNVTLNFTQPVFFDREDTMNRFVDKISKTLDRKYRLRFGAGYGG